MSYDINKLNFICVNCGKDYSNYKDNLKYILGSPICFVCYTGIKYVKDSILQEEWRCTLKQKEQ